MAMLFPMIMAPIPAEDDPHLGRCSLDDRSHRTAVQDVEPEDTAEQHDETDYDEHL
jgi:hypothetical protein